MSDRKETRPLSIYGGRGDEDVAGSGGLDFDSQQDQEFRGLLNRWDVPRTPASMDARVVAAYRQQIHSRVERQEVLMKQCPTCQEEFAHKFTFCPVDGTPLAEPMPAATVASSNVPPVHLGGAYAGQAALAGAGADYQLTFVDDTGLTRRLMNELKIVAHNSELTWPEFKRDPFGYTGRMVKGYSMLFWRFISSRNVAIGITAALFIVLTAVGAIIIAGQRKPGGGVALSNNDLAIQEIIAEIPDEEKPAKPDEGIGTGKEGRVGFARGKGEGSNPLPNKKAGGGGGGGMKDEAPAQVGRIPNPSEIPAQIPTTPPVRPPALPVAGINIDPALYKNLPYDRFGDPRSQSTATSSGQGTGNGMGTGTGAGIGSGNGEGYGPGNKRNMGGGDPSDGSGGIGGGTGDRGGIDYNKIFNPKEVEQKARILSRPEPQYTEEARKNQVSGTVVLRAVFSSSGQVTNIRAVSGLPYGLTERAIAAARQIRFSPAMKGGRAVSQYIQIEYNFNLY